MSISTLAPKKPVNWRHVGAWAAVVVALVITIAPFLWMLRTALSSNQSLASNAANLLPADFSWGAFKRVFGMQTAEEAIAEGGSGAAINFWLYLRNSIVFATMTTVGQVLFSAMAAYAFARLRWPGRDKVFALFLATMMVPPIFTALPNFLLIKNLGLLNTYAGIILPFLFMTPFAGPSHLGMVGLFVPVGTVAAGCE
jgi:multiple sugar transport system permease protein